MSSLVGRAELTLPLWEMLEPDWGPPRELRSEQPLLATSQYSTFAPDPGVRLVRADEIEVYLTAAVAMFIEEVGVDPRANDGGRVYRRRIGSLIAAGRAWARIEDGEVIYKAEIGSHRRPWARSRECGCIRSIGDAGSGPPALPASSMQSCAAAERQACMSTASTFRPGAPTRASD